MIRISSPRKTHEEYISTTSIFVPLCATYQSVQERVSHSPSIPAHRLISKGIRLPILVIFMMRLNTSCRWGTPSVLPVAWHIHNYLMYRSTFYVIRTKLRLMNTDCQINWINQIKQIWNRFNIQLAVLYVHNDIRTWRLKRITTFVYPQVNSTINGY